MTARPWVSPWLTFLLTENFTCWLLQNTQKKKQGKKKGYQAPPSVGPFAGVEPSVYFDVGGSQVKGMLEEVSERVVGVPSILLRDAGTYRAVWVSKSAGLGQVVQSAKRSSETLLSGLRRST